MNRTRLTLLLAIACAFLLSTASYADLIITPMDDYYLDHEGETERVARFFTANGPDGAVSVKSEPESDRELLKVPNGTEIRIEYAINHNGTVWGVAFIEALGYKAPAEDPDDSGAIPPGPALPSGWMPMEHLTLIYDSISFDEEHEKSYYDYTGYPEKLVGLEVYVYDYPGSANVDGPYKIDAQDRGTLNVIKGYRDEEGREWVFCDGAYGFHEKWICLDDAQNKKLADVNSNPATGTWESTLPDSGGKVPPTTLVVALIAGLVAGTAVLIRVFWRRNGGTDA